MDRLWAPWRIGYILQKKPEGCIFCGAGDGEESLVLSRRRHALVMMNRYPYTNGHLMAAPLRHTADPGVLSGEEMLDLMAAVVACRDALRATMNPDGFNVGMNLGRTAGAGIDDHLHIHVVPRWHGDTSFISVLDDVRVIPEGLAEVYRRLAPLFAKEEQ